jgi:Family of unknown function (DUF6132)
MLNSIKSIRNGIKITVIGAVVGGAAGFLYYRFIGCSSGSCMITSNPYISTLYGMLMGGLIADSFRIKKQTIQTK